MSTFVESSEIAASMDPAVQRPLSISIPASLYKPMHRVPVPRKAVPTRKPVGQDLATTPPRTSQPSSTTLESKTTQTECNTAPASTVRSSDTSRPDANRLPAYSPSCPTRQFVDQLPPGWTSTSDPDGKVFYMNHATKTSSWTKPGGYQKPLTSGWSERTTPDEKILHFNLPTLATTWEPQSAVYNLPPTPVCPEPLERQTSSTSTDSSFSQQLVSPLASPGIEWEAPQYRSRSSRRRSNFSLSSISSASSNVMSKLKLPPSASSNSVVKGTKSAAKLGLKGAKVTGKAIKDNRKVIGLGLKVANIVLKQTTGIDMGGLEGFMEGGGEIGGGDVECEDFGGGGEDGDGDEEDEEELENSNGVECVTEEEICVDEAVVDNQQVDETTCNQTETAVVTQDTITTETPTFENSNSTFVTHDVSTQEFTAQQVIVEEQTICQETIVVEQTTVEQQAACIGAFSGETFWAQETNIQETTFQETTVEQTTITETTVQEATIVETLTSSNEVHVEETTIETTQIQSVEVTSTSTEFETGQTIVAPPLVVEPLLIIEPTAPAVISPSAPSQPMEPFVFVPIMAGPLMVEPPAESNGVVFAPTYV